MKDELNVSASSPDTPTGTPITVCLDGPLMWRGAHPALGERAMLPLRRMLDFAAELNVTVKGNA